MAPRLVCFTGAGISADSGIDTFRGPEGLWEGHRIEEVADFRTWRHNRIKVHEFYNARRAKLRDVSPNAAHAAVAGWQASFGTDRVAVVTQNVDDLHERAGTPIVIHVHGRLSEMTCVACGTEWHVGYEAWDAAADRCSCGSLKGVKPSVVFFHEPAPRYGDMYKALGHLRRDDLLVVIGTSGVVVDIGRLAGALPCRSILSNLAPADHGALDEQFTETMHGRASDTAPTLDLLVRRHMYA